ncbi:MAG: hypothetical protein CVT70_05210 [Alphaproteobacteria bacterium HGW-Alphaproteobacteria-1]|jgi:uncharacterized membrane protein YphA (DoxX/SURF4 family)|nr:MAG: hypothetical protein CVT70_05210 [Alphaproteobacteria bacterium HGW-Alphaproteobacteria-1]
MKRAPVVDQIGLNLLRIVIGTYFMALALGLIEGFDPAALFYPVMGAVIAETVGATLLLSLAIWFMLGTTLRLAALSLALFVLSSSFMANFIAGPAENLSAFWYDLTLTCAVLLSYMALDTRSIRRASIFAHRARLRRIAALRRIKPRPVASGAATAKSASRRPRPKVTDEEETNIFANI